MANVAGPRHDDRLDRLLHETRRQIARDTGPDVQRILDWLHRQTGAHIALVLDGAGTVGLATTGFPREILPPLAPLLARVSGGRVAAAATEAGRLHVRCEALGADEARHVLVAAAESELSREESALISHAGSVVALLRRADDGERLRRGFQRKARQMRFAVFQTLLAGDEVLARRMTTGSVPPLLEADRLRIHLLHCPPADRDRISQAFQDHSGYHGRDLMVHCPAFKEHLICLVADRPGERDAAGSDGQAVDLGEELRRLVRDNPGYALGISGPHPLGATAAAYGQAAHALAAARTTPGNVVFYQGQTSLEGVLPRGPALAWARTVLRPLDSLPATTVEITRSLMSAPRAAVARLLGLSRNTVRAHIARAERALGLDLADARSRAVVNLALALTGAHAAPEPEDRQPSPTLDRLLRTERADVWARTFLRPLHDPQRRSLQAWIAANTDARQAAQDLGISRNTVRTHLRTAEARLARDLLTTGSGVHDVVLALRIGAVRNG